MCGRFAQITLGQALAKQFNLNESAQQVELFPRYNVAPTQPVAAIRLTADGQQRELTFFRWGLVPSWAKDITFGSRLINARSETVAEKPSFRSAFKRRRCLIPADGFYEWQKTDTGKQPMYIKATDDLPLALAGLWEMWQSPDGSTISTCTLLTTMPNALMQPIHNRMPVILEPEDYDMWLDPGPRPQEALHLLRPYPPDKMMAYPVSTWVNNPRHDDPSCIEPLV